MEELYLGLPRSRPGLSRWFMFNETTHTASVARQPRERLPRTACLMLRSGEDSEQSFQAERRTCSTGVGWNCSSGGDVLYCLHAESAGSVCDEARPSSSIREVSRAI